MEVPTGMGGRVPGSWRRPRRTRKPSSSCSARQALEVKSGALSHGLAGQLFQHQHACLRGCVAQDLFSCPATFPTTPNPRRAAQESPSSAHGMPQFQSAHQNPTNLSSAGFGPAGSARLAGAISGATTSPPCSSPARN